MKTTCLATVIVVLVVYFSAPTFAQDNTTVAVNFVSNPWGANVSLNGEFIGIAPLTVNIPPGRHQVSFLLPGFREWTDEIVVLLPDSTVFATLTGSDSLLQLYESPGFVNWSSDNQQVQLGPYQWTNGENVFMDYDFVSGTSTLTRYPFGWLKDREIRQQLEIEETDDNPLVAFQSPSGRYIGFPEQMDDGRWMLKFYDRENDTVHESLVTIDVRVTDTTRPSFRLAWSPNETVVGLQQSNAPGPAFCIFLDNKLPTTLLRSFTSDTGEELYVEETVSSPSNQGSLLVLSQVSNPEHPTHQLWLVDCASLTGTRIPLDGVFDATFLPPPNDNIIIVAHKNGISRININNLTESILITDIISERWGVFRVNLSPDAEYAIISAGDAYITTYWLYTLPEG